MFQFSVVQEGISLGDELLSENIEMSGNYIEYQKNIENEAIRFSHTNHSPNFFPWMCFVGTRHLRVFTITAV